MKGRIETACFHPLFFTKYGQHIHFIALRSVPGSCSIAAKPAERATINVFNVPLVNHIVLLVKYKFCPRCFLWVMIVTKCEKVNAVCKVRCAVVFTILCLVLDLPKVMNLLSFVLFRCAYTNV